MRGIYTAVVLGSFNAVGGFGDAYKRKIKEDCVVPTQPPVDNCPLKERFDNWIDILVCLAIKRVFVAVVVSIMNSSNLIQCNEGKDKNAVCVQLKARHFICQCSPGFEQKHGYCVDIDECAQKTHDCGITACVNREGSYECIGQNGLYYEGLKIIDGEFWIIDW